MNLVEIDACGLEKPLLISIIKRALSIAGGKPVIVTLDNLEAADQARSLAEAKRRHVSEEILTDGKIRLELRL